jgi:CBS domain-containing protein
MAPVTVKLYAEDPAGPAIDFMKERHMGLVPVVDKHNRFVGMVSGDRLMHFMLPKALMMLKGKKRMGYLHESREELQERLDELRSRTLGDLVDRDVKAVSPDTPLSEVALLITEKQFVVPVVEADGQLIGAVSFFSVLHWLGQEDTP